MEVKTIITPRISEVLDNKLIKSAIGIDKASHTGCYTDIPAMTSLEASSQLSSPSIR